MCALFVSFVSFVVCGLLLCLFQEIFHPVLKRIKLQTQCLSTDCFGLFAFPLGVIGGLYSLIVIFSRIFLTFASCD